MSTRLNVIPAESCCRTVVEPEPVHPTERDHLLTALKALADGTRFDIFRLIAAQHEAICACDVVDRFSVSQPTIAHHLKVLREANLITSTKRGVWAYYALAPEAEPLLQSLGQLTGVRQGVLV